MKSLFELLAEKEALATRRKGVVDQAMEAIADELEKIDAQAKTVKEEIDKAIAGKVEALRRDKVSGSIKFVLDGVEVKENRPKRVEWDQAKLAEVRTKIAAAGDNPDEYIDAKYIVPENRFKAWPTAIKNIFAPARTEKPGKPSVTFKPIKE